MSRKLFALDEFRCKASSPEVLLKVKTKKVLKFKRLSYAFNEAMTACDLNGRLCKPKLFRHSKDFPSFLADILANRDSNEDADGDVGEDSSEDSSEDSNSAFHIEVPLDT